MIKTLKIIICLLLLLLIINAIYLLIAEHTTKVLPIEFENPISNANEQSQDNYVVYTESNGVMTAPFVFGGRLYVYSIDEDKDYLISNLKLPFQEWGGSICFKGDQILVSGGFNLGGETPSKQWIVTLDGNKREILDSSMYNMALGNDEVFFIDYRGITIYRANLKTELKEKIIESDEQSFEKFIIFDDNLIAEDVNLNEIIIKNLTSKKKITFGLDKTYVTSMTRSAKNKFIAICGKKGEVIEYDLAKKTQKKLAVINSRAKGNPSNISENCMVSNRTLYCNDYEYNIVKVNLDTGKINKLIDVSRIGDVELMTVQYCKDYIAVETYCGENFKKKLQVFDYEGKLIKTKKIHNV